MKSTVVFEPEGGASVMKSTVVFEPEGRAPLPGQGWSRRIDLHVTTRLD